MTTLLRSVSSNYNKHWCTVATFKPNKTPSSSHPAALTSKRPLQNSGLLCEHKGPPGRTIRMTHRVTCKAYQPGSATKPAFHSPTQAVAALTHLWNCTGRTQEGNPGLSHIVFSEQIGLFIYLAIFNAQLQRKFGFLMRCDSARGSSHQRRVSVRAPIHVHTERFSKLFGFQNHSCLGKCKPVTTKNENSRERQTQYDKHTGLVHGHMHELFYHNICYCECHRRTFRGKTVICNVNMLAHILLFCLRAQKKKKKIFYIFWEKQEWYSQAPCWSWPESFQWFPCLQDAKRTHN